MIQGGSILDAPFGHGGIHVVFDVRVLARQQVLDRLLGLDDTAIVAEAGWPCHTAQENGECRQRYHCGEDDGDHYGQLGLVPPLVSNPWPEVEEDVEDQQAESDADQEQADGISHPVVEQF